ncbi:unnamed protein product [Rotaria magnacalcarata]|nr:unnamed protein product [Rotaria magnacalcarata]
MFINNCVSSSDWNCTMINNFIGQKQNLLFSNDQFSEQCTITVEYLNRQNEKLVCITHTLTITSLPPLSLSSNHTMQTFKINSCQLSTLGQLPFSLPSSVEILDLSYNSLSTFTLSFPLPSNLKYLYLDSNPDLIDINFGSNRAQQRLIGLSLRHNKKMKLLSLPPHLTQLDLTDCNLQQSSILPLLISLTKLTHLSLVNNQLERLPSLDESVRLEYLNVSNNHLTYIEDRWLHRQLRILDLTFNQIQSLEFFKDKLNMTSYINHSSADDYHDQIIVEHVLQLFLYGNPLKCDCWLGAILDLSPSTIIISDLHLLQCHSRPVLDIPHNELLCAYSRHCASDCSCCDFEACDCHSVCPSDCSCSHDAQWSRHIVKCPQANLSNIHILLPQTITELDYEENNIEHIKPFVFVGKTSLKKLNLAKNNLQNLTNDMFCAASNLRELNLSQNPDLIKVFQNMNDLFGCLKYLQHIILSKDQINNKEPISNEWMIFSNSNDNLVRLTRVTPKITVTTSSTTLLSILMSATNRPTRNSKFQFITVQPTYQQECTTFMPSTDLSVIRHIPFIQHKQHLIIVVFFLLLFLLLFLILLITLAVCRRRLHRRYTAELQRQRSHHYCYHHTRLHQPSTKTTDSQAMVGANDSLYEQLPSLSSDSEQPFLYNEKKSNVTKAPTLPPHPTTFRHHFCCHPTGHLIHTPTTSGHEYQYAATTTTGYSTPNSQQHQCGPILVWANRLLYPTENTHNHRDCTSPSCSAELQQLQQCLLSKQQDQTSITTENNIMRYSNTETLFVPTTSTCRCGSHMQNTDMYIYPRVHR